MRRIASLLAIGVTLIFAAPAVAQPRPGGGGPAARVPAGVTSHFHTIKGGGHGRGFGGPEIESMVGDFFDRALKSRPLPPNLGPADPSGDFQLDGERWTYREGEFVMSGILLKPEGEGPFPAVLISHGLGGSADTFGLTKAHEMVRWGFVCIAPAEGFPAPSAARAERVRAPFLILHGGADPVVRPQQSADFKVILDENRVPNERTVYDGEGHPIHQTQRERVFAAVRAWFEKHGAK